MPERNDIDPIPEHIDLAAVYLTSRQARELAREACEQSRKIARHVVSESEPERGILYRLRAVEQDTEDNSRAIKTIQSIPLRIAWIAIAAIVGVAAVGTATLVWNARPTDPPSRTP